MAIPLRRESKRLCWGEKGKRERRKNMARDNFNKHESLQFFRRERDVLIQLRSRPKRKKERRREERMSEWVLGNERWGERGEKEKKMCNLHLRHELQSYEGHLLI